ncbi:MAG: SDR family oxidoreductase [Gemmatimonadota bacterium]|jgi:NAD(P)-dependent dehydrogenase (short-subunit alcohol dehydrogenase family)
MDLADRVALVTGGARRVGRSLTLALARGGADVVVNYLHSQADARQTVAEVEALGRRGLALQADVSSRRQVTAMIDRVGQEFGRLDVVVNSASIFRSTPFLAIGDEDWDRVLAVNLTGPFLVMQASAALLAAHEGLIVNMADLSALQPWPGFAHHSVSKAGLVQLTRVAARALGPRIRVNCIAPGTVLPPEDYTQEQIADLRDRTALKRLGSPADVARALLFLVDSDFVTGEVVVLDGGRSLM